MNCECVRHTIRYLLRVGERVNCDCVRHNIRYLLRVGERDEL